MRLRVDPINCHAHGLCAELLPELITLDEWGYPIIDGRPAAPGAGEGGPQGRAVLPGAGAVAEA